MFVRRAAVLSVLACLCFSLQGCSPVDDPSVLTQKGLSLIQKGKTDEGFDLLRQAIKGEPKNPFGHMNYGGSLFAKAQKLFRAGRAEEAGVAFKEAEKELLAAADLFAKKDARSKAHCYYLVAEIYQYVYEQNEAAQGFYAKAIGAFPEHREAKQAMADIAADEK